mgnify:CR=1 FL=1
MDKKSNKKYIFNIVLILSLGILVIYLTMKDDLKASLEALVNASPVWIVFSVFLMGIYYILDAGPCTIGVESTVVEVHDDKVIILRPGGITKAQLETVVSTVEYDTALVGAETKPKAPGMKYTHYAPDAPMTVVVGTPESVANTFNELSKGIEGPIGCLVSHETYELIKDDSRFMCHCFGHHGDALALGHDFYKSLLHFNENHVTLILAEGVNDDGFGVAIMNRMEKASGHHIIYK